MNDSQNLEYVEGLPQDRLPGAILHEFRETVPEDVAGNIPHTQHDSGVPKGHRYPQTTFPSYTYTNTNGDLGLNQNIPFGRANSVRVDNYTAQWCRVGGVFIEPQTYGWVIPLAHAGTNAKLTWEAPPGQTQPAAVTGELAYTTWYEERFPHETGKNVGGGGSGGSGGATLSTGQATVDSSGTTQIKAANTNRTSLAVTNNSGTSVWLGNTGVSTTTGWELPTGVTAVFYGSEAVFGVVSSASKVVSFAEESK